MNFHAQSAVLCGKIKEWIRCLINIPNPSPLLPEILIALLNISCAGLLSIDGVVFIPELNKKKKREFWLKSFISRLEIPSDPFPAGISPEKNRDIGALPDIGGVWLQNYPNLLKMRGEIPPGNNLGKARLEKLRDRGFPEVPGEKNPLK